MLGATTDDVHVFVELIFVCVILSYLFSFSKMIYIIHYPTRLRGNADQVRFRGGVAGGKKKRIISLLCLFSEKEPEKAIVLHEKRILIVPTTRNINKSNHSRYAHAFAVATKIVHRTSLSDQSRPKHME